jgi:hypothetical protein
MGRRRQDSPVVCPLLRIHEAAERLGCEPAALWALLHAGTLPGVVRLDLYYIKVAALDLILDRLTAPETH